MWGWGGKVRVIPWLLGTAVLTLPQRPWTRRLAVPCSQEPHLAFHSGPILDRTQVKDTHKVCELLPNSESLLYYSPKASI